MKELTMTQRFAQARTAYNETAQQVADKLGCSREYLYEVLKYPNKNPEIFKKACEYISSAGVKLPDSEENLAPSQ